MLIIGYITQLYDWLYDVPLIYSNSVSHIVTLYNLVKCLYWQLEMEGVVEIHQDPFNKIGSN